MSPTVGPRPAPDTPPSRPVHPPLLLVPRYEARPWGGRRLETHLGRHDLPPGPVGESWEAGDLDGWCSVVDGGPFDGHPLSAVLGRPFPLLLKVLDAREDLSVQVHPDGADGGPLKEEAWVALGAGGAALLGRGPFDPLPSGAGWLAVLARQVLAGPAPGRAPSLVHVPPGTVHALLAGSLVYEVQNPADVTWRLYDHDRRDAAGRPRALHGAEAAALLARRPRAPLRPAPEDGALVTPRFRLRLLAPGRRRLTDMLALFCLGAARVAPAGQAPFAVPAGRTVVLPPLPVEVESDEWAIATGEVGESPG